MANKENAAAPGETDAVQDGVITVSLNEFCARLSETVNRPELIGGFAFSERAAGHQRGTAEEFAARYEVFINKPV